MKLTTNIPMIRFGSDNKPGETHDSGNPGQPATTDELFPTHEVINPPRRREGDPPIGPVKGRGRRRNGRS